MLMIRLQRVGRKHDPSFRVVVTQSKNSTKSGRFLEVVGSHNPKTKMTDLKADRIQEWMKNGAQVSDTIRNMLITKGIITGKKVNVLPKKRPIVSEAPEEAPKATVAAPAPVAVAEEVAEAPAVDAEAPAEEATA
jgi:small subunit ribosomal protein S16